MSSGAKAPGVLGDDAAIRLRIDRFLLATRVLGCESDAARARLLGVDRKSVERARAGEAGAPGGRFVAKTLVSLARYKDQLQEYGFQVTFEEFFEVVIDEKAAS